MNKRTHRSWIQTLALGFLKAVAAVALCFTLLVLGSSFSAIYRFRAPEPFSGPDIFNPYRHLDTALCWKRANFHTHTRVKGPWPPNECPVWPQGTYDSLRGYGYDIVTFSNHNEITWHPFDTALQVNVYEHGYNLFKFHKLVFGSDHVIHYDPLLPVLASHKQFQLDYLGRTADIVQINHPYRTIGTSEPHFRKLSGYQLMELDSGRGDKNEYWDWALSAGHYSFGVANDDLHYPNRAGYIAVRCNFLCCPSARYPDIRHTLLDGCFYAMRVPDFGNGDWAVKHEKNKHLPSLLDIGLKGSEIYLRLSEPADRLVVTGQDGATLAEAEHTDSLRYLLRPEDPYARVTAYFPEGEVLYTNPFARYDASRADSPFRNDPQPVNWPLTLLYNLLVAALCAGVVFLLYQLFRKK